MKRAHLFVAPLAAALLLTAGCTSKAEDPTVGAGASTTSTGPVATTGPSETTATTGAAATSSTAAEPTGIDPATFTTKPEEDRAGGPATLVAVRTAQQQGFVRTVFEFRGVRPGYSVSYTGKPITADGTGDPVAVAGDKPLTVAMLSASGFDGTTGAPTYTGPKRIPVNLGSVTEVVRTGDFEGYLTWVIGTQGGPGFGVRTLTDPPRIIVDVRS